MSTWTSGIAGIADVAVASVLDKSEEELSILIT